MIHGIPMSKKTLKDLNVDAHIAVLHTKVDALLEKQKELTARVRANEKVVAAVTLLGTVALAVIGAGFFAPNAEAEIRNDMVLPDPILEIVVEEDIPEYYNSKVTLYDTRVAHMGHDFPTWPTAGEMIHAIRDHEAKKNRSSVEDMLNSSLAEYENGSNDPTEQEVLLQLPSNGD